MDRHPGRFTLQSSRVVLTQCGSVAEWLCSGLQLRVRRFDSDPSLHFRFSCCLPVIGKFVASRATRADLEAKRVSCTR